MTETADHNRHACHQCERCIGAPRDLDCMRCVHFTCKQAPPKPPAGERDLACASHESKQGEIHAVPLDLKAPDTKPKSIGAEVVPIGIAKAGRVIARQALDREDTSSALYLLERSIVRLLSDAQAMRRHFEDTGEMLPRVVARSMDLVASSMVKATGGVDLF